MINGSKVLILGLTFKENCPDIRNTKVADMYAALKTFNIQLDVFDPWVNEVEAYDEYGIELIGTPLNKGYDGIILAVPHNDFIEMGAAKIKEFGNDGSVFYDVKSVFPANSSDIRL